MPIVTEAGFAPIPDVAFATPDTLETSEARALDLPADHDPEGLVSAFQRLDLIRIPFASFADGRGFSLARRLRALGFRGRLRAAGGVISDQFRYALDCGFDDVEISDALAARQPEPHWRADAPPGGGYRARLSRSSVDA